MFKDEDVDNYLDQHWLVVQYRPEMGRSIVVGTVYPSAQDAPTIVAPHNQLVLTHEEFLAHLPGLELSKLPTVLKYILTLFGEDPDQTFDEGYVYKVYKFDGHWPAWSRGE
tara:strand:- start:226 stop:558 length:333 start_codon:yes stop_codon:yes gene_type:complete